MAGLEEVERYETRDGPILGFRGDIYISRSLQLYGEWSPGERRLFSQLVKPGMTVVEIGANIGSHTVGLARACAPGPIYAFEPQQPIFQLLCANLIENGIRNAIASPDACGEAHGFAVVPRLNYAGSNNFGGLPLAPEGAEGLRVRVIPLDDIELSACHFLKIDVEGFEPKVLKGAINTIRKCRPRVYIENDRPEHQQEIIDQLHELDYHMYWDCPPLFDPNNFKKNAENVFGGIVSQNLLCFPAELRQKVGGGAPLDPKNWRSRLSK